MYSVVSAVHFNIGTVDAGLRIVDLKLGKVHCRTRIVDLRLKT
jgi:hypothetical protein